MAGVRLDGQTILKKGVVCQDKKDHRLLPDSNQVCFAEIATRGFQECGLCPFLKSLTDSSRLLICTKPSNNASFIKILKFQYVKKTPITFPGVLDLWP